MSIFALELLVIVIVCLIVCACCRCKVFARSHFLSFGLSVLLAVSS